MQAVAIALCLIEPDLRFGRAPEYSTDVSHMRKTIPVLAGFSAVFLLRSQPPVTFARDIAPILRENCISCHRPGESGPFPLVGYQDAKKHARQIAAVTSSRFMPPWLPEPGYGDFEGAHRLTAAQIKAIGDWVNGGAPEGEQSEAPVPGAAAEDWQLGPPDLVLKAAQPFVLPAE